LNAKSPLTFDQSTSNGGGRAIAHGRLPMPTKAFPRSFHEGRKKRGKLAWREITRWSESDPKSRRCADGANLDMVGVTGSIPVVPTILRSRSKRRMPRRSPVAKAGCGRELWPRKPHFPSGEVKLRCLIPADCYRAACCR